MECFIKYRIYLTMLLIFLGLYFAWTPLAVMMIGIILIYYSGIMHYREKLSLFLKSYGSLIILVGLFVAYPPLALIGLGIVIYYWPEK